MLLVGTAAAAALGSVQLWQLQPGVIACAAPVSYTHLDVYKRQSFTRSKSASKSVIPGNTGDTKQTVRIPASYTCFIAEIRLSLIHICELNGIYAQYPQVLVNVTANAAQKKAYKEDEVLAGFIENEQQKLMQPVFSFLQSLRPPSSESPWKFLLMLPGLPSALFFHPPARTK